MQRFVPLLAISLSSLLCATLQGGEKEDLSKKLVQEPEADRWELKIGVPSWVAGLRGDSGINGNTSHVTIGFNELVNKIDMAGSLRTELTRGRFGIMTDFSYLSVSDGVGADGILSKLDVQEDQILAEFGLRWKVIEGPRGWLEIIGGTRYTYLYEQLGLHSNDQRIGEVSNALAVAPALAGFRLAGVLRSLAGNEGGFSRLDLGRDEAAELAVAIGRIRGNIDEREKAIEKLLTKRLNRRLSRTDQWFDPYIGLRGQYNFSEKCYFLGRADISPFDVGADFAWQASAGFGYNVTDRIFGELVYRILSVDYRHDGLIYDMVTYGPELNVGIKF